MEMNVLLLDSSFYPIQIINWQKAMTLFFGGRAQIIEHHENKLIRSPNKSFKFPKVIRLISKFKHASYVKFSREHIFYRDNFKCQYCGSYFVKTELTLDHIYPRSRGGETSWENIISACKPCNNRKADRTPKEAKMPLLSKPKEPSSFSMIIKKLKGNKISSFKNWLI